MPDTNPRSSPQIAIALTEQKPTAPHEDQTMTNLKSKVAAQEYSVDSNLVAEEIIRKLRMIRWARHELVSEPGRNHQPKLRGL